MKRLGLAGFALLVLALLAPFAIALAGIAAQPQSGGFGAVLFRDDFSSPTLSKAWSVFRGSNGQTGPRSADNVTVHDGVLDLAVQQQPGEHSAWGSWAGGSVCACTASVSTYGRYTVRAMSTGGAGFRSVALTWPVKGNGWPPEMDLHESTDPHSDMVTTHYVDPAKPRSDGQDHGPRTPVDVTAWHDYSVEWTPALVRYLLDGQQVATSARIPTVPMWLGLTAAMHGGGVHPGTPQHYLVDYVEVDSYVPTGGAPGVGLKPGSVPAQYVAALTAAGALCPTVTPPLLAAQIQQESGWNPQAVSPSGAQGLSQFMPGTWATWGRDVNNDGSASPFDPFDAIDAQARYDCALAAQVSGVAGDKVSLMLAAYNAGPGALLQYQGIPPFPETQNYVRAILALIPQYAAPAPSGGGAPGQPTAAIPCAAGTDRGVASAPENVPIRLCEVGGVIVNTTLSGPLAQLLGAAAGSGLTLGGGGFRSEAEQIALRKAHCGTSDYAIWHMPASQCSPPTAIPGTSMHESGLAIDFTSSGTLIGSHSDPAWQWLSVYAATYGLHPLSSEPWHWSTNGN